MKVKINEKQSRRIAKSIFDDILAYCEKSKERFENFKENMEDSNYETKPN